MSNSLVLLEAGKSCLVRPRGRNVGTSIKLSLSNLDVAAKSTKTTIIKFEIPTFYEFIKS
jgi:hypothetical protein